MVGRQHQQPAAHQVRPDPSWLPLSNVLQTDDLRLHRSKETYEAEQRAADTAREAQAAKEQARVKAEADAAAASAAAKRKAEDDIEAMLARLKSQTGR